MLEYGNWGKNSPLQHVRLLLAVPGVLHDGHRRLVGLKFDVS